MSPLVWCISAYVLLHLAAVVWMYVRAREREPFLRHATRRSAVLAPLNACAHAFSAVPRRAVLDPRLFPELAPLAERWQELRDEAEALVASRAIEGPSWTNDPRIAAFRERGWTRFYLKWHGDFLPSALAACPRSVEAVRAIPSIRGAMFAVLPAGAVLEPHTDPFAGGLRYHLGLRTPGSAACRIVVDGQAFAWRDGEAFVFDETYLHDARNDTAEDRLILFCDVERPMRSRLAAAIQRAARAALMKTTAIQNADTDPVAWPSRVFGWAHGVFRRA